MKNTADSGVVVSDEAVISILRKAAERLILPRYQNLADTEVKTKTSATDFVTIADREAEAFIAPALLSLLPGSACIGEESVAEGKTAINAVDKRFIWTVDPVDGTRNFVAGTEHFCCMVSLIDDLEPIKSWIYRPLLDDAVVATKGKGVRHYQADGQVVTCTARCREGEMPTLQGTLNAMGFDLSIRNAVRDRLRGLKGRFHLGSAGIDAVYIALGQSDYLMHSKLTPWDTVPVDLTCRELGYHAGLAPDARRFGWQEKGVFLAASSPEQWHHMARYIWSGIR